MQARVDRWPASPGLDDHVRTLVDLYGAQG
jgi:hypothetical protein